MIGSRLGIYGSSGGGGAQLLLDEYPGAAAAYSLRKIRADYAGSAIRVRRSSDDAEQDIGFSGTDLDTSALTTFVGAGNGFVVTRYDQSGNGLDLTNAAAAAQPQIVTSGTLYKFNEKPYILYDGGDDVLSSNTNTNFGTDSRSIFLVNKPNLINNAGIVSLTDTSGAGSGSLWIITLELAIRASSIVWGSSTPPSTVTPSLISNIYTSGFLFAGNSMWLNGESVVRTSGSDGAVNTVSGLLNEGTNGFATHYSGYVSDTIIYQSDQSSNRSAIEQNINDYYSIY